MLQQKMAQRAVVVRVRQRRMLVFWNFRFCVRLRVMVMMLAAGMLMLGRL